MEKKGLYVYHDERYGFSWLSEETSEKITDYLLNRGFEGLKTEELAEVMKSGAKNPDTDIVIVFSHDVIPDRLLDSTSTPTSKSLFREFLDAGHTVIWLADVPAWYVGFPDGRVERLKQPVSINNLVGLSEPTRFTEEEIPVKPTLEGLLLGVKPWKGLRPHLPKPQKGFDLLPLAVSREGIHGYVCSLSPLSRAISGLVRLYDFKIKDPKKLTSEMLDCIFNIASKRVSEIFSLLWKFEILRVEVEEKLGRKMDLILKIIKEVSERKNTYTA